jgi:uncharacterized membrane protein
VATIEKSIEVGVPVRVAYNQWTQFEEFPQFMEGVKSVEQLDPAHLRWTAEIGGQEHTWEAEITSQQPDQMVAWRAKDGKYNSGKVRFLPITADTTRIDVEMTYDAEGLTEELGSALGFDSRQVGKDLERFKEFVESRGAETGAWRGQIHQSSGTER